ncbi:unnamed protein product [Sphagnum jensenii]|uniref:Cell division cycle protein 123 n=1 Tax=Sphagnum jensenii TaxID=128206 RepID=A0ABP0VFA6_9BRYO
MITINATEDDILQCHYSKWIKGFSKVTPLSIVVNTDANFTEYMAQDGIFLPVEESEDQLQGNDLQGASESNSESVHRISHLIVQLNEAIKALKAPVFVKLNWTAPTDAEWINGNSLKCYNANDILLLLKSSDRVAFDMQHMFDMCLHHSANDLPRPNAIILRRWLDVNPAMEFRLFVFNKRLKRICQRDCTTYYPFLKQSRNSLRRVLTSFFNLKLENKFALASYTADVYVTPAGRVWLLDFNPAGAPTSALLYEWSDFADIIYHHSSAAAEQTPAEECEVEFSLVENEAEVLPSSKGAARGPIDVAAPEFSDFMRLCQLQATSSDIDLEADEG